MRIAYPPPAAQRSEPSYRRLTSQTPNGWLDIIKLQYTDHEVHRTSRTSRIAVVVDFKASYSLRDRRWWRDGAVDCFAVCPVLGTITEESIGPIPIPPNTGKYWPILNTPIPVSFEPYCWTVADHVWCEKQAAAWSVMAVGMWGYTPVQITGVLVFILCCFV